MLTFTSRQLDSIAASTLLHSLEYHWHASFPMRLKDADAAQVREWATQCVAAAGERGFSSRNDLFRYADLYLLAHTPGRSLGGGIH